MRRSLQPYTKLYYFNFIVLQHYLLSTYLQFADGNLFFMRPECEVDYITEVLEQSDPNQRSFSATATYLLLDLYFQRVQQFMDRTVKKRPLWVEISKHMANKGYYFPESDIERKFRNLKRHYLNIKDKNTKTGKGRLTWPYYEKMEEIFSTDGYETSTTGAVFIIDGSKLHSLKRQTFVRPISMNRGIAKKGTYQIIPVKRM